MFRCSPKYRNFTFYAHNFARYDFIFIYNIIKRANVNKGFEYYKLNLFTRDDSILKLSIQIQPQAGKAIRIYFVDSLNLLNFSLGQLAKDFAVPTHKTHFPYEFVKKGTLLYIGPTPDIKDYPKLNNAAIYQSLIKENWDLKQETIDYLQNDLKALLEIMNEFSDKLYLDLNTELTEATTISRLSIWAYKRIKYSIFKLLYLQINLYWPNSY